jgi:hypothetical protein
MKNGILITENKYQSALRLSVFSIVAYLLYSTALAIYGYFPLQPESTILGFEFSEPHIQIRVLRLMLSVIGVLLITIVPILFIWAKIEDKFFTEE